MRNFRGVRAQAPFDADDAAFCAGVAVLEELNLTLDGHGNDSEGFSRIKAVALKFPRLTIVLNHCGAGMGPSKSDAEVARWRADISDLAASCPNLVVKVGGLQMVVNGYKFEERSTPVGSEELCAMVLPYYQHVIEAFTPARCCFESNFPVDKECCSHRVLYNMFKRVASALGLSEAEKADIFHDVAMRTYRLADTFCTKL